MAHKSASHCCGSQLAGGIHFCVCNKEALPCVRRYSWWVRPVSGGTFFSQNTEALLWVLAVRWRNHYFARNKEELSLHATMDLVGPSRQALHVQSSSHPHLLLFSDDFSRTSQPSYSPPRGQPLPCLPRLRVVPFVGLAIVHCPGALGMAWSTMSIQRP